MDDYNTRKGAMTWRGSALYEAMRVLARQCPRAVALPDLPLIDGKFAGCGHAVALLVAKGYAKKVTVSARGKSWPAYQMTEAGLALWMCVSEPRDRRTG